ncbi:MAG TPA: hypothetical protein DEQ51_02705 [Alphaproteobacteria bacterium]|nr:hypothetical protein [Alphaproteobacteria bacterium]
MIKSCSVIFLGVLSAHNLSDLTGVFWRTTGPKTQMIRKINQTGCNLDAPHLRRAVFSRQLRHRHVL